MRHSIVLKFIAVFLCAASLLGITGSAVGIFAMTELDLYERSFGEAYEEHMENYASMLADEIAVRYASTALGGCNTQMVDAYYGSVWSGSTFDWNSIGYELKDADGEVLQAYELENGRPEYTFTFPADGKYMKVLATMTEAEKNAQEMATAPTEENLAGIQVSIIPEGDVPVYGFTIEYSDGSGEDTDYAEAPMGILTWHENGRYLFWSFENLGWLGMAEGLTPTYIAFRDIDGITVYEAASDGETVIFSYSYEGDVTWMELPGQEETIAYDDIPAGGRTVSRLTVTYVDGSAESVGGVPNIGFLYNDENGNVVFKASDAGIIDFQQQKVTYIAFSDENDSLIYEAGSTDGVGTFYFDEAGDLWFRGDPQAEMDIPAETIPEAVTVQETAGEDSIAALKETESETTVPTLEETQPETTEPTMAQETVPETSVVATIPETTEATQPVTAAEEQETLEPTVETMLPEAREVEAAPENTDFEVEPVMTAPYEWMETAAGVRYFGYYDQDIGEHMVAEYTFVEMPEYTVEIAFAPGAMTHAYEWELLRLAYVYQDQLFLILGVSLLVFAVMAVYLCCAAGRKPGRAEIHAGGLNCIPLDLYLGIGILGEMALFWAGAEGVPYLLRSNFQVGLIFALLVVYAASLVFVAFCFACAAQFKTPGDYWWHNSICGRCLKLIIRGWKWMIKACVWLAAHYDSKLEPALIRFFKGLWKLILFFWGLFVKGIQLLYRLTEKGTRWMGDKLVRFFAMLPVTWQWLLAGGIMIFALFVTVAERYDTGIVLSILFAVALVIYGAHCFGVLLESTKRMSKGDLDAKVDDKLLVGSFQEFADELNGLADVAVVAAQKQLKSERMKTELITNVSHDIKTPLTSIINYVDLLQKPHTDEEQEVYLEVLDRQSQRLKKLIEDLMEMSKASTGNLAVDIQKVDAAEAINQALGEFADKLDKAQLIPVFRQPEESIEMMADGRLVWRVMSNLLGNAVKYALPGTRVYLDLVAVDDKVIISMKNISREELNVQADELLERFVRGDVSRNTDGSGLGLNIAQSLMELQKGQLQLLVDGDLFKVTLIFPGV